MTGIPRAVAVGMSMLSSPIPIRETIRSWGADSMTRRVTFAQLQAIAWTPRASSQSVASSPAGASMTSMPSGSSRPRSIAESGQARSVINSRETPDISKPHEVTKPSERTAGRSVPAA